MRFTRSILNASAGAAISIARPTICAAAMEPSEHNTRASCSARTGSSGTSKMHLSRTIRKHRVRTGTSGITPENGLDLSVHQSLAGKGLISESYAAGRDLSWPIQIGEQKVFSTLLQQFSETSAGFCRSFTRYSYKSKYSTRLSNDLQVALWLPSCLILYCPVPGAAMISRG